MRPPVLHQDIPAFPSRTFRHYHGVLKSDQPRNYPLNKTTALCVNTVFAYQNSR